MRPVVAVLGHSIAMLMETTVAMDYNFIVYSSANLLLAMIIDNGLQLL